MIDDELACQEAAKRGITVSEAEVDQAIQSAYSFYPNGSPTPTITPTGVSFPTLSPDTLAFVTLTPLPTNTPLVTNTPTNTATNTRLPLHRSNHQTACHGNGHDDGSSSPTATLTGTPGPTDTPAYGHALHASGIPTNLSDQRCELFKDGADRKSIALLV